MALLAILCVAMMASTAACSSYTSILSPKPKPSTETSGIDLPILPNNALPPVCLTGDIPSTVPVSQFETGGSRPLLFPFSYNDTYVEWMVSPATGLLCNLSIAVRLFDGLDPVHLNVSLYDTAIPVADIMAGRSRPVLQKSATVSLDGYAQAQFCPGPAMYLNQAQMITVVVTLGFNYKMPLVIMLGDGYAQGLLYGPTYPGAEGLVTAAGLETRMTMVETVNGCEPFNPTTMESSGHGATSQLSTESDIQPTPIMTAIRMLPST